MFLVLCLMLRDSCFWVRVPKKQYTSLHPEDIFFAFAFLKEKRVPDHLLRQGRIQIFFRRGCTRLFLYFNTNKPQFFCRIPVVLENRRSSQEGGVRTRCTLPLDPPLYAVLLNRFLTMNKADKASHDQQQANRHQWYRKQKLHHAVYVNTEKLNSKSVYFFFKEDTLCKTECKKDKKGHTKWLKAMGMFIFSPLSSFEWRLK